MSDLPFSAPLTDANPAAPPPRKCRKHEWTWIGETPEEGERCRFCPAVRDVQRERRGRNNRARGNAIEREVGHRLGLKRVGQYGGATDLGESHDPFAVSVKSGSGYFSERYWDQLKRQPIAAGQTALLVVTDARGSGHARRAMVVLSLDSWVQLHGLSGVAEVPDAHR